MQINHLLAFILFLCLHGFVHAWFNYHTASTGCQGCHQQTSIPMYNQPCWCHLDHDCDHHQLSDWVIIINCDGECRQQQPLLAESQPNLAGLVWDWQSTQHLVCIHQTNSHYSLCRQHHKRYHGISTIIIIITVIIITVIIMRAKEQHVLENVDVWISITREVRMTAISSNDVFLNSALNGLPERSFLLLRHHLSIAQSQPLHQLSTRTYKEIVKINVLTTTTTTTTMFPHSFHQYFIPLCMNCTPWGHIYSCKLITSPVLWNTSLLYMISLNLSTRKHNEIIKLKIKL